MRFYLDAFCPKLSSFLRPRAREMIWFWTKCAWNYSLLSIFTIWLLIHIYQIEGKQQISDSDTVWTAEYPMYVSSPFKLFYLKMTGQYTFDVHVLVRSFLFSSRAALHQNIHLLTGLKREIHAVGIQAKYCYKKHFKILRKSSLNTAITIVKRNF